MQYISEKEIDQAAYQTGAELAREPKLKLVIPSVDNEEFWVGGINGYFFKIRTNRTVFVPQSIAELITGGQAIIYAGG
jgi:hypothetical protein